MSNSNKAALLNLPVLTTMVLLAIGTLFLVYNFQSNQQNPVTGTNAIDDSQPSTEQNQQLHYTVKELSPADWDTTMESAYSIDNLFQYDIKMNDDIEYQINVVKYSDKEKESRNAIVYLPAMHTDNNDDNTADTANTDMRYERWTKSVAAIKQYTPDNALFVTYWDNAQRIHLFTGRHASQFLPSKHAYGTQQEMQLWNAIAGGFDNGEKSDLLSRLLLQDADVAMSSLISHFPDHENMYLFVCTDDLAHIEELSRISGQGIPLETRVFPSDADLHSNISKIKEWASEENGTGSYLLQPISERFIRAWRVTDKAFENSLLVRLLPFTSSLDKALNQTKLVYQSDWGAYISIYQITP